MGIEVTEDETDKKRRAGIYEPLAIKGRKPGYRYRLLNKNQQNLSRRQMQGFEIVQGDDPEQLVGVGPSLPFKEGTPVATTREFHDVVLARIPEELAAQHDKEVKDLTRRRTKGIDAKFKKDVGEDNAFDEPRGGGMSTVYSGSMDEAQHDALTAGGKGK